MLLSILFRKNYDIVEIFDSTLLIQWTRKSLIKLFVPTQHWLVASYYCKKISWQRAKDAVQQLSTLENLSFNECHSSTCSSSWAGPDKKPSDAHILPALELNDYFAKSIGSIGSLSSNFCHHHSWRKFLGNFGKIILCRWLNIPFIGWFGGAVAKGSKALLLK